jgi:hypothetical protein
MDGEEQFEVLDALAEIKVALDNLAEAFARFMAVYGTPEEESTSPPPLDR